MLHDWFHLSIINEYMRSGPHVVPQVAAGEALSHHAFSYPHVANASAISGLDRELVLARLWVLPMLLLTTALIHALAGAVTAKQWAGPVACWLAFAGLSGNAIWPDRSVTLASPLATLSPSQLFANPVMMAGAIRARCDGSQCSGVAISFLAADHLHCRGRSEADGDSGTPRVEQAHSPSQSPAWWIDRRAPRRLLMALGTLLAVQLVWTAINSAPARQPERTPGRWAALRSIVSCTGARGLRANSTTLLLDSLDGTRAWLAAAASTGLARRGAGNQTHRRRHHLPLPDADRSSRLVDDRRARRRVGHVLSRRPEWLRAGLLRVDGGAHRRSTDRLVAHQPPR